MRKILIAFALILINAISYAQTPYPINQTIGAPTTLVSSRGGFKADSAFILPYYLDTTKANISPYGKSYAGALIRVGDSIYMRNTTATKWINVTQSGGGGGGNSWLVGGNTNAIPPYIGNADQKELDFITNNAVRLRIPDNGIIRKTAAINKFLVIDTVTKYIYYTDGIDTTSLSNRINLKLNISDTGSMLSPYLRKADTASLSNRINQKIDSLKRNVGTDSVFARKNGQWIFQYKDSVGGGGSAGVTSISQGYGIVASPNPIINTGTIAVDTTILSAIYARPVTYTPTIVPYANSAGALTGAISDMRYISGIFYVGNTNPIGTENAIDLNNGRATIYGNYNGMRINVGSGKTGTVDAVKSIEFWNRGTRYAYFGSSGSGGIGNNWFKMDSADLYLPRVAGTSDSIAVIEAVTGKLKPKLISYGTVNSVATGYGLSGGTITNTGTLLVDTSTLSTKYLRVSDTTNKWVNNITRTPGKDSIIYYIGSTRYAIKDSVGTNPPASGYYGAFQDTVTQTAAVSNTGYLSLIHI